MSDDKLPKNTTANFLIFTAETGTPQIEVRVEGEMVALPRPLSDSSTVQNISPGWNE